MALLRGWQAAPTLPVYQITEIQISPGLEMGWTAFPILGGWDINEVQSFLDFFQRLGLLGGGTNRRAVPQTQP